MKAKLKEILYDIPQDFLLEIIDILCVKNKHLENEIEMILAPSKVKYAQSYYNRMVKTAIDTNSWSHFPNKGIVGLEDSIKKMEALKLAKNPIEADKIKVAINGVIERCLNKYNNQNQDKLDEIYAKINKD